MSFILAEFRAKVLVDLQLVRHREPLFWTPSVFRSLTMFNNFSIKILSIFEIFRVFRILQYFQFLKC